MNVGEYQFSATLLMALLTLSLAFVLPLKVGLRDDVNRSRWLLATGSLLLTVHFYLQYRLGFRTAGNVDDSVFLNLLFFMPASWLINLSMLYLLRKGNLQLWEWLTGPIVYGVSLAILIAGKLWDSGWTTLKNAEYVVSTIYGITLLFYNVQEFFEFRRIKRALDKFYDHSMQDRIRWFGISLTLLALVALSSPISIFYNRRFVLIGYGIIIIVCIFYYVLSFICFSVSESTYLISIAEEEEENEAIVLPESVNKNANSNNNNQRVEQAITKWLEKRGHLKTGITIQDAVDEMQIPRYLLVQWIKNTEFEVFSRWITHLRVEEAKRLLAAHSDYSNEAIAHECGFSSRSYFQKIFREQTGMTPVEYQTKKTRASS
jgi:AraC-like DNA-binding protein